MKQITMLLRNPSFSFGAAFILISMFIALFGPVLLGTNPFERAGMPFEAPSLEHVLGTNSQGQDALAQLFSGLRSSLMVGVSAGLLATIVGTLIGLFSGYKGGFIDNVLTMLTNLFLVIPSLIILILISNSVEKRSLLLVAVIIGATTWTWTARAVRAQTQSLKNRDHVNLAKLNGYSTLSIIILHILPYILSYVFMAFILQMASGILSEAAISMLGLGPYDTVSLGLILHYAQQNEALVNGNWWVFMPATILISLITFSLYLMNTAMEGVFNPRLRK
ncbi:MAG: ABC transporter permease subunit [Chitinivibrionales bacterium]|nr:ABC transporter permease subunit [Chitinivibrionales bacterium]